MSFYIGQRVHETADSRAARVAVDGDAYTARGEIIGGPWTLNESRYWLVRWDGALYSQHEFESNIEVDHEPQPYSDLGYGSELDVASHNAAVDREQRIARESIEEAHWDAREHEARWGGG